MGMHGSAAGGGTWVGGASVRVILSIGGWTKTTVGALLAPKADAVTWTAPVPMGVQVVKAASQRPAQARPLGAILRMLVSLDWNVKAAEMVEFELF